MVVFVVSIIILAAAVVATLLPCGDSGIFVRGGGVQVSLTKIALTFFFFFFFFFLSPQLILQKSNENYQGPEGVQHFPGGGGGGPTFSRGGDGGVQ